MLNFHPISATVGKGDVEAILRAIEEKRGRRVFAFCQDTTAEEDGIYPTALIELKDALAQEGDIPKLTVLLESSGGDIHTAYRMLRVLRHHSKDVEVIVTRWAKSAATFLCLGADAILMARDAELGPLDTQLADLKKGSSHRKSALLEFKSLEYLSQHVTETLDRVAYSLMLRYHMDAPYALKAARPLVASILAPLYSQVDPHELGANRLYLAVAEEYSKLVMKRFSYPSLTDDQREAIVRQLVWDYPSHAFVIDLESMKELGLNAQRLDAGNVCALRGLT